MSDQSPWAVPSYQSSRMTRESKPLLSPVMVMACASVVGWLPAYWASSQVLHFGMYGPSLLGHLVSVCAISFILVVVAWQWSWPKTLTRQMGALAGWTIGVMTAAPSASHAAMEWSLLRADHLRGTEDIQAQELTLTVGICVVAPVAAAALHALGVTALVSLQPRPETAEPMEVDSRVWGLAAMLCLPAFVMSGGIGVSLSRLLEAMLYTTGEAPLLSTIVGVTCLASVMLMGVIATLVSVVFTYDLGCRLWQRGASGVDRLTTLVLVLSGWWVMGPGIEATLLEQDWATAPMDYVVVWRILVAAPPAIVAVVIVLVLGTRGGHPSLPTPGGWTWDASILGLVGWISALYLVVFGAVAAMLGPVVTITPLGDGSPLEYLSNPNVPLLSGLRTSLLWVCLGLFAGVWWPEPLLRLAAWIRERVDR